MRNVVPLNDLEISQPDTILGVRPEHLLKQARL